MGVCQQEAQPQCWHVSSPRPSATNVCTRWCGSLLKQLSRIPVPSRATPSSPVSAAEWDRFRCPEGRTNPAPPAWDHPQEQHRGNRRGPARGPAGETVQREKPAPEVADSQAQSKMSFGSEETESARCVPPKGRPCRAQAGGRKVSGHPGATREEGGGQTPAPSSSPAHTGPRQPMAQAGATGNTDHGFSPEEVTSLS